MMAATLFQYRCRCGHRGRPYRDPNTAAAYAETHVGIDVERSRCRQRRMSPPPLYQLDELTGTWTKVE